MERLSLSPFSVILLNMLLPVRGAPTFIADGPSYICAQNAVIIWKMLQFFFASFLAHALSTPVGAETGRYTAHVPLRSALPWGPTICLFLPFGGLTRNIILINQQLKRRNDHVRAALTHGAILIVARNSEWKPSWEKELIYLSVPSNFHDMSAEEAFKQNLYAEIVVESEGDSHNAVDQEDLQLHGEFKLPNGYSFATPSDKSITEHIIDKSMVDPKKTKIHRVQNPLKVLFSAIQIGYATYTLYNTPGPQITRWGYASYGLTVFPYGLMSIMNAICSGVVGSYHCGHALRTPILREAEQRGAVVDGAIGRVKDEEVELGNKAQSGYIAAHVWLNRPCGDDGPPMLTIDAGKHGRGTFKTNPGAAIPDDQRVRFAVSPVTHDGPRDPSMYASYKSISWMELGSIGVLFAIAMILPEVLTYKLTGFHAGESTKPQRAFMVAWLVADQLAAFGTLASWLLWQRKNSLVPKGVHIICLLILIVPAAGGLLMVGQMFLKEQGFSVCQCSSTVS